MYVLVCLYMGSLRSIDKITPPTQCKFKHSMQSAASAVAYRTAGLASTSYLLSLKFTLYFLLFTGVYISDTTDASNAETDTDY